jgi:PTH2 family peptidyl-tRNA hydrolase
MGKIFFYILFLIPLIFIYYLKKLFLMQSPEENDSSNDLKKEILEFGFEEDKVDLAMKLSNNKEEICNLIVKMMEEPDFYSQMKNNFQINANQQNNKINNDNLVMDFTNLFQNINSQQYKMVIVVRKDLNMSVGKTSAQVAHAALGAYKKSLSKNSEIVLNWENISGQAKIVLSVENEKQLMEIKNKADQSGLITCLIHDAGRTEVSPNTATCCAIGPDLVQKIDTITGKLKLL